MSYPSLMNSKKCVRPTRVRQLDCRLVDIGRAVMTGVIPEHLIQAYSRGPVFWDGGAITRHTLPL
jgi:hypothetical protein